MPYVSHSRISLGSITFSIVLYLGAFPCRSSTNNFAVPTFRGQPNSEIGFWERFAVPYGTPGNAADQPGNTSGAIVTQTLSPSAFATGSGNIYDLAAPMAFIGHVVREPWSD